MTSKRRAWRLISNPNRAADQQVGVLHILITQAQARDLLTDFISQLHNPGGIELEFWGELIDEDVPTRDASWT